MIKYPNKALFVALLLSVGAVAGCDHAVDSGPSVSTWVDNRYNIRYTYLSVGQPPTYRCGLLVPYYGTDGHEQYSNGFTNISWNHTALTLNRHPLPENHTNCLWVWNGTNLFEVAIQPEWFMPNEKCAFAIPKPQEIMKMFPLVWSTNKLAMPVASPATQDIDLTNFVYVADVHNVPVPGEKFTNTWLHVHGMLDEAGIHNYMESAHGVASVSVECNRAGEAVELLRKDAISKGYWIEIAKAFQ